MNEPFADLWDRRRSRVRRFTLIDMMTIVAWIAVLCSAASGVVAADLPPDRKSLALLLAMACPTVCAFLWFLSGVELSRWRWLNGPLALLTVLLTVLDALLLLALGWVHPASAGVTCVTLSGLIVYLATWDR